ncbi:sensor histidine kinase [Microvirga antarctica]|uniref:sensor histidine kinase n=1 Tax=Microvirga antarctica TaxID=2819233 RepID=UPI001B30EF65|nr:sensor histidine kinase [Microvirga antarctica]
MSLQATFTSAGKRSQQNLARQFLFVASGVLLFGMIAQGVWVTRKIEEGVTDVAATQAALYINSFVAPHLQELAHRDSLSVQNIEALNVAMTSRAVRDHVTAINVWKREGLIAYSTQADLIGRRFPANPSPNIAWEGAVTTVFDNLAFEEDHREITNGFQVLEVYAPIRDFNSGNVIAVLEFHERAEPLAAELKQAQWHSWGVSGLITILMIGALFSIVARGSKTIDQQRLALSARVAELSTLLHQNDILRGRIALGAQNAADNLERGIRRLGYDLHDGVAQLVSLALLRLDRLQPGKDGAENMERIREALLEALADIRNLCRGMLLPEVEKLGFSEALRYMVAHHERKTGTKVESSFNNLPSRAPDFVKISLCRFLQEGLNNSFKHGNAANQRVSVCGDGKAVIIDISDDGPGIGVSLDNGDVRLGLKGLRDRISSLGGELTIVSKPGEGTALSARLPLPEDDAHGG